MTLGEKFRAKEIRDEMERRWPTQPPNGHADEKTDPGFRPEHG